MPVRQRAERPLRQRAERPLRQRGFSLIELLVAFTILALSLSAIYAVLSTGSRSLKLVADYAQAAEWAESHLASLGVSEPLQEGEQSGAFGERFQWRQQTTLALDTASRLDELAPLYRVLLTIEWRSAGQQRRQLFEALKLGEAP